MAKTLTFGLIVALAFILGHGSYTGSTVGDFGGTNRPLGLAVLSIVAVGGAIVYRKYRMDTKDKE